MKTTNKHFQIFKEECQKWIDKFGLSGWEVSFVHQTYSENTYATCFTALVGMRATIYFTDKWDNEIRKISPETIKQSAKHEAIHLLLARLSDNGRARYINELEMNEAEEELVRKLEKIIK